MTTAQICIMAVIVAYLAMMVVIGAVYSKRTNNVGDFYLIVVTKQEKDNFVNFIYSKNGFKFRLIHVVFRFHLS